MSCGSEVAQDMEHVLSCHMPLMSRASPWHLVMGLLLASAGVGESASWSQSHLRGAGTLEQCRVLASSAL